MIRVNLTTFLDIVCAAGAPRVTALRRLKERGDYNPAHDFWPPLRCAMVQAHRREDITLLDGLMATINDKKNLAARDVYAELNQCGLAARDSR